MEDDPRRARALRGDAARLPTKTSIGIILCRKNETTRHPEVLLVHKRYTYAFAEFVHGRYARKSAPRAKGQNSVMALLEHMTNEELLDVWSLDFDQMWYRIWLSREKRDLYNRKNAKFQSTFMRDDGGAGLRHAIQQAHSQGALLWEVPKGRRISPRESDIICGVRELHEETGIDKSDYRFLPGVRRRVSYVSSGTRYVCIYYVAIANPRLSGAGPGPGDPGRPALREIEHMGEVSEIRWYDIERVRLLDGPGARLASLVSPAFRLMNQYLKGRWASRRHAGPPPLAAPPPAPPPAPAPEDDGWRRQGRAKRR
jgi:8-oxo-dGTP pyrophosphatase MutT (NUDIX family)